MPDYLHFAPSDAMRMLRCDASELIGLAMHLTDQCHQGSDALELAAATGDWRQVSAIIHRIRNGCAVLCAQPCAQLARELDDKVSRRSLRLEDLQLLSRSLRELAIELLRFAAAEQQRPEPALPLAA